VSERILNLSRRRRAGIRWHNKIEAVLFTRNGRSTKLSAGSANHFHAKQDKP
jgi:hypothetical protein